MTQAGRGGFSSSPLPTRRDPRGSMQTPSQRGFQARHYRVDLPSVGLFAFTRFKLAIELHSSDDGNVQLTGEKF